MVLCVHAQGQRLPFISDHINFFIHQFFRSAMPVKTIGNRQVDLRMNNNWQLPGSDHEVTFKTCIFRQQPAFWDWILYIPDCRYCQGCFSADKLVFNSTQLSDLYEKDKLVIDTIVTQAIITLRATEQPTSADTTKQINDRFRKLFKDLPSIISISVRGALLLQKRTTHRTTYLTQRTDLKIYTVYGYSRTVRILLLTVYKQNCVTFVL